MKYELTLEQVAEVYGVDTSKKIGRIVGVEEDSFGKFKNYNDYVILDFSEDGIVPIEEPFVVDICQHNGFSIPSFKKEDEFIRSLPQDMQVKIKYGLISSDVESKTFLQSRIYPNTEEKDFEIGLQTEEGPTSKIPLPQESFEIIYRKYLELFRFLHDGDYSTISVEDAQEIVGNDFEVKEKLKKRIKYREDKNWERADEIRDEFEKYGLKLADYKDSKFRTSIETHPKLLSYAKLLKDVYDSVEESTLAHFQASLHETFLKEYFDGSDLLIDFEFKYISDEEKNQEDYDHIRDEHKESPLLIVPEIQLIPEADVIDDRNQMNKLFRKIKAKNTDEDQTSISSDLLDDLIKVTGKDIRPSPQREIRRHNALFEEKTQLGHNDPKFIVIRTQRKHILDEGLEWLKN